MPLVADDGARPLGARPRDRGHRPRARPPRSRPTSSCPTPTATRSDSRRACAARRCCSSRGRRGEAAASTCPCGRHCAPSCIRTGSRSSRSRSTSTPTRHARSSSRPAPQHPSLIDSGPRRRRAVRHRQRAQRRLDRRGRHDRAARGAGAPRSQPGRPSRSARSTCRPCRPTSPRCSPKRARSRAIPTCTVAMLRDWVGERRREPVRARARRGRRAARTRAPTTRRPRRPSSSSASTCTATATTTPRSRTGATRTGCIPTTGRTSARRGTSRIPMRQGHTDAYDSSLVRGHQEDRRRELLPADRPLTRGASRLGRRQFGIG